MYRLNRQSDKNKKPKQHSPEMFDSPSAINDAVYRVLCVSIGASPLLVSLSHSTFLLQKKNVFAFRTVVQLNSVTWRCFIPFNCRPSRSLSPVDTDTSHWHRSIESRVCMCVVILSLLNANEAVVACSHPKHTRVLPGMAVGRTSLPNIHRITLPPHCHINRAQMDIGVDLLSITV